MPLEFSDAKEAAAAYINFGWYPIPLAAGTKACRHEDWRERIYVPEEFEPGDNIGIRLVKESDVRQKKVVGVDFDCQEAVLAANLMPETEAVWGRESKSISQMLYLSRFERPIVYKDLNPKCEKKPTLIEIRVDHQSMAPPSIWTDKDNPSWQEKLHWKYDNIEAHEVDPKILKRCVQMVATAALAGRYYNPPGNRHDWSLALCGTMKQFGLTEDECWSVMEAAGRISGDSKTKDRRADVRTTYVRADDDPTAGIGKLVEIMGEENGKPFAESLRKIWAERSPFRMDGAGKKILANDQANVRRALSQMEVRIYKDVFRHRLLVKRGTDAPVFYDDDIRNALWLEMDNRFHFRPPIEFFEIVLKSLADGNQVHPVRDYLDSLKWDGKPRIDRWLTEYGGARENEYTKAVGSIVLVAAVKRVNQPGCKFDELMVLESPQGQNKSTALRTLTPFDDWFSDDLPLGVDSKQIIERTSGKWIVEAAELMNMRKAQVESLKSFLSRQIDGPVRLAYERNSREIPRQFIIVGTTNSSTYLKDMTGNRRFWPVKIKTFEVGRLRTDRDQLWAEAVAREADGMQIRLPPGLWGEAHKHQEARRTEDPWESVIGRFLAGLETDGKEQRLDPEEVWKALEISVEKRDERSAERIAAIMQANGFRKMSMRKGGAVIRGWGRDLIDGIWRPAGWDG